jgi:hypothetical protein
MTRSDGLARIHPTTREAGDWGLGSSGDAQHDPFTNLERQIFFMSTSHAFCDMILDILEKQVHVPKSWTRGTRIYRYGAGFTPQQYSSPPF